MADIKLIMQSTLAVERQSDFFRSSIPLTYDYFIKNGLHNKYANQDGNSFDMFIKEKIPFLAFLIDQFYKNNQPSSLRLCSLTDERMLGHLDKDILEYITSGNEKILNDVKNLYIYVLESCIIKLSLNKGNGQSK